MYDSYQVIGGYTGWNEGIWEIGNDILFFPLGCLAPNYHEVAKGIFRGCGHHKREIWCTLSGHCLFLICVHGIRILLRWWSAYDDSISFLWRASTVESDLNQHRASNLLSCRYWTVRLLACGLAAVRQQWEGILDSKPGHEAIILWLEAARSFEPDMKNTHAARWRFARLNRLPIALRFLFDGSSKKAFGFWRTTRGSRWPLRYFWVEVMHKIDFVTSRSYGFRKEERLPCRDQ